MGRVCPFISSAIQNLNNNLNFQTDSALQYLYSYTLTYDTYGVYESDKLGPFQYLVTWPTHH